MPQTLPLHTLSSWQEQLADLLTDPLELLRCLNLQPSEVGYSEAALHEFPLRVPRAYVARMRPGDARDPLLLQVLPALAELAQTPGYALDPLEEASATVAPGILHKYQGRVLLITTQACAIHCRYCFRRHFPYADNRQSRADWEQSLCYIERDGSIEEVILSGGDPLALSASHLDWLFERLRRIPHLRRLRLHTRLPLVLPDRVDARLCEQLRALPWPAVVVLSANHAREFDAAVDSACAKLREAGVTLLNQSVLLAGINDEAEPLTALSQRLFSAGVLPYYLHLPDPVQGTAHFDVSLARAQELLATLRARLPGYLVPRLVREEAGKPGKTLL
ncbi:MAG: EF-P beta-lysylation protein EpmB [Pseudomonadales bacterium]|jgi:EF-P beta-lysylation protein EpmB|nr:EF-P beta-lysylation protein EpmB [Pseudomonadales bacterium]